MTSHRKAYWSLGKHTPFKTSFDKLLPQDKWRVEFAIGELMFDKNPQKRYRGVRCTDCGIDESFHLTAVAFDGIGNMGVELLFKINITKNILTPIFTRRIRFFNSGRLVHR